MGWLAVLRWLAFLFYVVLAFAIAPGLLWGGAGMIAGASIGILFLCALRLGGVKRLAIHQASLPLTLAQASHAHRIVEEYCRRLQLPKPTLRILETSGVNIGTYGYSRSENFVVITRGALTALNREQLAAVLARILCRVWTGEVGNETWLARFFDVLHRVVTAYEPKKMPVTQALLLRRTVKQVLFYPLTLFPAFVLKGSVDEKEMDLRTVRMTQAPQALSEAYRLMEALSERVPYRAPFSCRHLFLAAPATADPLARLFFGGTGFSRRIQHVETLYTLAPAP
jgi:hypothetical protein